jgi:hypothetical protein
LKRQETNRLLIRSNKKHGEPGAQLEVPVAGAPKGADRFHPA